MRKIAVLGILVLAAAVAPASSHAAFTFEVHPGLYNSYEYTDNYRGDVRDARSESIYFVGPSIAITGVSPTLSFDFNGRYAKSYHDRFPEDDSPDIDLSSRVSHTVPRLATTASYAFSRSLTRESLSEPFGEERTHAGSVASTWNATRTTSLTAGYDVSVENWIGDATAEEDVTTHSGHVGLARRLSPMTAVNVAVRHSLHDYEESQDVAETNGSVRLDHTLTQELSTGLLSSYNHEDRGDLPNEDRYDVRLTGRYTFPHATVVGLEAGCSWLFTRAFTRVQRPPTSSIRPTGYRWIVEEDRVQDTAFVGSASLEKSLEHDRITVRVAKEYTSEFTTDRYGTYDTTSASLDWVRDFLKGWTSTVHCAVDKRKPTGDTQDEDETDATGSFTVAWNPIEQFALAWKPIEYLLLSVGYEHLLTEYETSGTARENRYRVMTEVRF